MIPNAQAQLATLAREKAAAQRDLAAARQQRDALVEAPQALNLAEHREAAARERVQPAGRAGFEGAGLRAGKGDAGRNRPANSRCWARGPTALRTETSEERAEREQVAAARKAIAQQSERLAQQTAAALARLDGALAALPAAHDERQLTAAAQSMAEARAALAAADRTLMTAVRDAQAREELCRQSAALVQRRGQCAARGARVESGTGPLEPLRALHEQRRTDRAGDRRRRPRTVGAGQRPAAELLRATLHGVDPHAAANRQRRAKGGLRHRRARRRYRTEQERGSDERRRAHFRRGLPDTGDRAVPGPAHRAALQRRCSPTRRTGRSTRSASACSWR